MIRVEVERADSIDDYASIPISYRVTEALDPDSPAGPGSSLPFAVRPADKPVDKDYDSLPGNKPSDWAARFDISTWGFLAAYEGDRRVGGAIVVTNCADIDMLEGRDDLALLWDIRVAPSARQQGVGTLLLDAAQQLAKSRGARVMKVETQNNNVPACRFYAANGFALRAVNKEAYPDLPHEVQFLWYKDLIQNDELTSGSGNH